ncbi:MAG: hypothetical protein HC929_11665 [Leptolyngbyaceae cyanobacterium SM2_5_2]|nr:hypothetical protein [Leptolyngbyaceae cyanobacterium SM2_5_2]
MARYPLYLSMLVLMATDSSQGNAPITGRASLIRHFCEHQQQSPGSRPQDRAALSWLAHQLAHQPHQFRLDRLDRTWLPASQRLLYRASDGVEPGAHFLAGGSQSGLGPGGGVGVLTA